MTYAIKLEQFEGPLDLLLQLVESKELDISTVSLANVTEQYLDYLETIEERFPEELADFLVVATKLLLLKSRLLLPDLPVADDDEETLAEQLRIYKDYLAAAHSLEALIGERRFLYGRPPQAMKIESVFSPPPDLAASRLRDFFRDVLSGIEAFISLPEERLRRSVSLHERIMDLQALIQENLTVSFKNILEKAESKSEVIITFLALLELVKRRIIHVRQHEHFGDIAIERAHH